MTQRMIAKTFRETFMRVNKPWLRDNMHEIFTPRTLFLYRKEIIDQFQQVLGPISPNISLSSKKSKSTHSSSEKDYSFDPEEFKKSVHPNATSRKIIRFWIF